MSLKLSYTVLAPIYDFVAGRAFNRARAASLAPLHARAGQHVFLDGVGTGLDLEHLAAGHRYTALDLTRAMLTRGVRRRSDLELDWVQGDSQALPFSNDTFDCAVLHLIVAVVPRPADALSEAARVVKTGGRLLLLDKFLAAGSRAPLRRLMSPVLSRIATRTDVVFETLIDALPRLRVIHDEPALARGWFRRIVLEKI